MLNWIVRNGTVFDIRSHETCPDNITLSSRVWQHDLLNFERIIKKWQHRSFSKFNFIIWNKNNICHFVLRIISSKFLSSTAIHSWSLTLKFYSARFVIVSVIAAISWRIKIFCSISCQWPTFKHLKLTVSSRKSNHKGKDLVSKPFTGCHHLTF